MKLCQIQEKSVIIQPVARNQSAVRFTLSEKKDSISSSGSCLQSIGNLISSIWNGIKALFCGSSKIVKTEEIKKADKRSEIEKSAQWNVIKKILTEGGFGEDQIPRISSSFFQKTPVEIKKYANYVQHNILIVPRDRSKKTTCSVDKSQEILKNIKDNTLVILNESRVIKSLGGNSLQAFVGHPISANAIYSGFQIDSNSKGDSIDPLNIGVCIANDSASKEDIFFSILRAAFNADYTHLVFVDIDFNKSVTDAIIEKFFPAHFENISFTFSN